MGHRLIKVETTTIQATFQGPLLARTEKMTVKKTQELAKNASSGLAAAKSTLSLSTTDYTDSTDFDFQRSC